MHFESWVSDRYSNVSLSSAVKRHSSHGGLKKFHKALHMADSMVRGETVVDFVVGKYSGLGDTLMVITNERVLLLRNTFQTGQSLSFDLQTLDQAKLSYFPLLGHTLTLNGHRLSRIPAPFVAVLRNLLTAKLSEHWAVAA
ncbi:hypothetical protein ACN082_09185 [Rothia sp. CCM 9417]|uniref:hypothetical protein n=1 Tax=Rothia sp. CCM 9417 TaxID=3402657 RepID=UPI003AE43668